MCFGGRPQVAAAPMLIPATQNPEAQRQADLEAALRRRRAGAAHDVLTSPTGIPQAVSTSKLGGVAS